MDFSVDNDNLLSDLKHVAKGLLQHGVTSFCPTVVTSRPDLYRKVCVTLCNQSAFYNYELPVMVYRMLFAKLIILSLMLC